MKDSEKDALGPFRHRESDQSELFPYRPMFSADVFATAQSLVAEEGRQAPAIAGLRESDDLNGESDRLFWIEVRRATKFILKFGTPMT